MFLHLIEITALLKSFKPAILSFVTAFVVCMIIMPVLIQVINRFKFHDAPDVRKMHAMPVPTMGGVAVCAGLAAGVLLWFDFSRENYVISFFFSVAVLFLLGILDDLKNISARNKFVIQFAVASLIAFSGIRVQSFNGLFGIYELPITIQYILTLIALTGITNAFNLIDGIDGLAASLGIISLVVLGYTLTRSGDANSALVAFAMAGSLLGFLYYNFNPARIFMGDTGSLVLGFIVGVLCIRLMQLNLYPGDVLLPHAPVFALSIVLIPVFDTLRVFSLRMYNRKSPFSPDQSHLHHLLTTKGWSHSFTAKLICGVHALLILVAYLVKDISPEPAFFLLVVIMVLMVIVFRRMSFTHRT